MINNLPPLYDQKFTAIRQYHGLSKRVSRVVSIETLNRAAELVLEAGGQIIQGDFSSRKLSEGR